MLDIIYFSTTASNNTHKFVQKLHMPTAYRVPTKGDVTPDTLNMPEINPFILITPTYGTGKEDREMIPAQVRKLLNNRDIRKNCAGVIAAGHMNFGPEYGLAGNIISEKLHIPLLYKFELAGTGEDVEKVTAGLTVFAGNYRSNLITA